MDIQLQANLACLTLDARERENGTEILPTREEYNALKRSIQCELRARELRNYVGAGL